MLSFGTAFLAEGAGTSLTVDGVTCTNNYLKQAFDDKFSRNFNLVVAMDQSIATVSNIIFGDNDGVDVSLLMIFIFSMHCII